jgi:hypothetical protein
MSKSIVYGLGGYDPSKPNDNIVEEIEIEDELVINSAIDSAIAKLSALGLTDEEIQAITKMGG